jgi:hypothetical protein
VAHDRPSVSDVVPPDPASSRRAGAGQRARLTRAEALALRRSAPLTPQQFKELSRLAERGINPLRHI